MVSHTDGIIRKFPALSDKLMVARHFPRYHQMPVKGGGAAGIFEAALGEWKKNSEDFLGQLQLVMSCEYFE